MQAKLKELEEENQLLFDQLTVVQEALERMYHEKKAAIQQPSVDVIELQWVDDKVLKLQAEYLRCTALLKTQQEIHRVERDNSLASRLGHTLIEGVATPGAVLALPGRLLKLWRKYSKSAAPKVLGGSSFSKVIETYEKEGAQGVELLLETADVSNHIQANAWTAVARNLVKTAPQAALEAARRAYAAEPKGFRLKWLGFRLHDAGELAEAEAVMAMLPPDIAFSESELRQREELEQEAEYLRMKQAKQELDYTYARQRIDEELERFSQEAQRQKALVTQLQADKEALQRQLSDATRARDDASARLEKVKEELRLSAAQAQRDGEFRSGVNQTLQTIAERVGSLEAAITAQATQQPVVTSEKPTVVATSKFYKSRKKK